MTLSPNTKNLLKALRHAPFAPVGTLYRSIYEDLARQGLVVETIAGFVLTDLGRKELEEPKS